jgi:hypothetical protein
MSSRFLLSFSIVPFSIGEFKIGKYVRLVALQLCKSAP